MHEVLYATRISHEFTIWSTRSSASLICNCSPLVYHKSTSVYSVITCNETFLSICAKTKGDSKRLWSNAILESSSTISLENA